MKKYWRIIEIATCLVSFILTANASHTNRKVLVVGANFSEEQSWVEAKTHDGKPWALGLKQKGIDLTTLNDSQYIPTSIPGKHIEVDWNGNNQLQSVLAGYSESFDFIINDYGVSYFIHDHTIPAFLNTLAVGGKFVYGPLNNHTSVGLLAGMPVAEEIESVAIPSDISFTRDSFCLIENGQPIQLNAQMTDNSEDLYRDLTDKIYRWNGSLEAKDLLAKYVGTLCDRMTIKNFKNFLNASCNFKVNFEIVDRSSPDVQRGCNEILPPEHPGKSWADRGDWIVFTRMPK